MAELRDLHPTDVVNRLQAPARCPAASRWWRSSPTSRWPICSRRCPRRRPCALVEGLDLERAAHILEEMEPDDAADLLADLAETERARHPRGDAPGGVDPALRRLLAYDENTAGGTP